MDEAEKSTQALEAEILEAIEADRVLIEQVERERAEGLRALGQAEEALRNLRRRFRQLTAS